jgi:hypothetical protein
MAEIGMVPVDDLLGISVIGTSFDFVVIGVMAKEAGAEEEAVTPALVDATLNGQQVTLCPW